MVGADGQKNVPHSDWLRIFERVLNEVKTEMKEQGREGDFVGAKVASFSDEFDQPFTTLTGYLLHRAPPHSRSAGMVH
jgi:adenosine deaminase CECR1